MGVSFGMVTLPMNGFKQSSINGELSTFSSIVVACYMKNRDLL